MVQLELPGRVLLRTHELGRAQVAVAHDDGMSEFVVRAKKHAVPATEGAHTQYRVVAEPDGVRVADERAGRCPSDEPGAADEQSGPNVGLRLEASEPRAVAPRRDLGEQSRTNANELESAAELGEADVVRRHAQSGAAEESLGLVDRFPALFERREVPASALRADHPQPPLLRIVRQPTPDGKRRKVVVGAEVEVAEQTAGVHSGTGKWEAVTSDSACYWPDEPSASPVSVRLSAGSAFGEAGVGGDFADGSC